ncbi:MAG: hypothetical protein M1431_05595 [Candidatus Thermoplasmatota archaeon]|nr:hypothetical protein [Candidatus Thermoplasmatota archaeon]
MNQIARRIETIPTSSFSSVMGIGIVSDAFLQLRLYAISETLEYICLLVYLGLVSVFLIMIFTGREKSQNHPFNITYILGIFTFVAGSAVLFTRLSESGYIFVDLPAILLTISFTTALAFILLRHFGNGIMDQVEKPYLFLVPFIALFGISVLSSQAYSKLGTWHPYLFSISSVSWLLGFAGTIIFMIYTLIKFRDKFLDPKELEGFYFIYSGIASLAAFSAILILTFYHINDPIIVSVSRYVLMGLYVWAVAFSALLFYLYFIKFKKGLVEFRHRVSFWGAVFPMGVDSLGSYFISNYIHIGFLIYFAYFYAFIGILLIITAFVEILLGIDLPDSRNS